MVTKKNTTFYCIFISNKYDDHNFHSYIILITIIHVTNAKYLKGSNTAKCFNCIQPKYNTNCTFNNNRLHNYNSYHAPVNPYLQINSVRCTGNEWNFIGLLSFVTQSVQLYPFCFNLLEALYSHHQRT